MKSSQQQPSQLPLINPKPPLPRQVSLRILVGATLVYSLGIFTGALLFGAGARGAPQCAPCAPCPPFKISDQRSDVDVKHIVRWAAAHLLSTSHLILINFPTPRVTTNARPVVTFVSVQPDIEFVVCVAGLGSCRSVRWRRHIFRRILSQDVRV